MGYEQHCFTLRLIPKRLENDRLIEAVKGPIYTEEASMRITKLLRISSFQIIIGSFLAVILTGTLLLMLPVSSAEGAATPFGDALFTATSAVCVTGLVVHDTFRYWSLFGQLCILLLIQIGGLGTITLATVVTMLAGRKISLFQRSIMKDAVSAD